MIIKTDDRGYVSEITNNDGSQLEPNYILSADIKMRGAKQTQVTMTAIFNNSSLSISVDDVELIAKIPESFNLMTEDEKLLFLSMCEEYGYIEKDDTRSEPKESH